MQSKQLLLVTVSALWALAPGASWAQQASPPAAPASPPAVPTSPAAALPAATPPADQPVEEIDVVGFRHSLESAIDAKRDATSIIDTIAAEDIGKFPEQNLAESLQRITGVQISRFEGEGQYVSIRGLDPKFTQVDLDGREMPSPTGVRSFDFSILSSEFVGAADVYKSPEAELTEGGLAGTVNVRTINPLDVTDRRIVLVTKGGYDENSGNTDPRVTGLYADSLLDGRLGVVAGVDYSKRSLLNYQYQAYGMQPFTGALQSPVENWNTKGNNNTPYLFDNAQYFNAVTGDQERTTYLLSTSYKITPELNVYGQFLNSEFINDTVTISNAVRFVNIGIPNGIQSSTISNATSPPLLTTVDAHDVDYRNNGRTDYYDNTLESYAVGTNFASGPWSFNGDLSTSRAKEEVTSLALEALGRANVTSTISGGPAQISFDPGYNPLNPAQFNALGVNGSYDQPTVDAIEAGKFDLKYKGLADWLPAISVGFRIGDETNSETQQNLDVSAQQLAGLLGVPYNPNIEGGSINAAKYMSEYSYNFFGQNQTYLSADLNKLYNSVSLARLLATAPPVVNLANTFKIDELSYAGYAKVDFAVPNTDITGNVGFRLVSTDENSGGYAPNLSLIRFNQQGAQTIVPQVTPVSIKQNYTELLPSLNLAYDLTSDVVLRFAAARTMTRPDLSQLAPNTVVNANVQSITEGNPNLKPYSANQFDLSAEWYFGKGGLLSGALFYKDVNNFIQNGLSSTTLNVNQVQGGTIPVKFSVLQPVNAGETSVEGAEFGYQQPFTFLPAPWDGFGVLLNYTYVYADPLQVVQGAAPVPLAGVSKNNYNLTGYYENDRFGIRAAYTYRDKYVVDPYSYFGDGDYRLSYGQLDLSATYHINQQFDATVEALNVTDNALVDVDRYGINRGYETDGRTILFGLRAKF